jgi:hypothetical protein
MPLGGDVAADDPSVFEWKEDGQAADSHLGFGQRLSECGDLYRRPGYASGLLLILDGGKHVVIARVRTSPSDRGTGARPRPETR